MEDAIRVRNTKMKRLHRELLGLKEGEEKYDLIYSLYVYFMFSDENEKAAIYDLYSMIAKIYGMSEIVAWATTVKIARKLAREY